MAKGNSTIRGQLGAIGPAAENSRVEKRERLSQRIGRFLAHTWLGRRSETEASETSNGDAPPEDRAT